MAIDDGLVGLMCIQLSFAQYACVCTKGASYHDNISHKVIPKVLGRNPSVKMSQDVLETVSETQASVDVPITHHRSSLGFC